MSLIDIIFGNVISSVATVLIAVCYIPQIIKMIKEPETIKAMSKGYWLTLGTALFCMLLNSIYVFVTTGTFGFMIAEIFDFGLGFIIIILMYTLGRKNK